MEEKPVRRQGLRANCNFIDEFEVELDQKMFEEVIAGFFKKDSKPFSEEVIMVGTPKEKKNDN